MASYCLRPATPEDRDFLIAVYAGTREAELNQVDWDPQRKTDFIRMQFDAQDLYYREYYPGAVFQVIAVDETPIGRLYLHRRLGEIRVMDICILPAWRGRGTGTSVLKDVLAQTSLAGLPVTVHVERFNPALAWYQRLGFRLAEDRGVYLFLKWEPD